MPFVLDASIAAAWALADESSPIAERADARLDTDRAIVPRIWWYEIRNLLVINERRTRLSLMDSVAFLQNLSGYPIDVIDFEDEEAIFRIARLHRLSFYDASYLALAQLRGLSLATLDKAMQAAATAAGVPLLA